MRTESLRWLACPAPGCAGPLAPLPSFHTRTDPEGVELTEAVLGCDRCWAEYPVVLGVALLETDLGSYLAAFWGEIESCGAGMPTAGISRRMLAYLGVPSAFTGRSGPAPEPDASLRWATSPYLQAHFDLGSVGDDLPSGWWRDAVEGHRAARVDPYSYLIGAARDRAAGSPMQGLSVDVGTSVGRGAAELAAFYEYSIGVDRSFRAILAARRHLVSAPEPLGEYQLESEKGRWEARTLPDAAARGNLDFVVASGAALPVASGAAACIAAVNVLCAVSEPAMLLDDFSRSLEPGGLLLLSSPFWSDDAEPPIGNPKTLKRALAPAFDIDADEDMVPWVLRLAKRRWNVYLCHCVVATRH